MGGEPEVAISELKPSKTRQGQLWKVTVADQIEMISNGTIRNFIPSLHLPMSSCITLPTLTHLGCFLKNSKPWRFGAFGSGRLVDGVVNLKILAVPWHHPNSPAGCPRSKEGQEGGTGRRFSLEEIRWPLMDGWSVNERFL